MEPTSLPLVAITGADGQVGQALLGRLAGARLVTAALTRNESAVPADHHVIGSLDSDAAQELLRRADVIVHLAGTLRPVGDNSYWAANVETTEAVARAARLGRAGRLLLVSFVGASETSSNPYLRTKRIAERLLGETGREAVVFRCSHIVGTTEAPGPTATALQAVGGGAVTVFGDGRQRVAPVFRGDVAATLHAAVAGGSAGVYDLVGPDTMTMDDLVRLVNGPDVRIRHLPAWAARLLGRLLPSLPPALVDVLLRDATGDSSAAQAAFGISLTHLAAVWGARAPRAGAA